eukprot:9075992-Alexandrium_andersonii.AAC.1
MSASLVGSEMCIRDSPSAPLWDALQRVSGRLRQGLSNQPGRVRGAGACLLYTSDAACSV